MPLLTPTWIYLTWASLWQGDTMLVECEDGSEVEVVIPEGVESGQDFEVEL